MRKRSDGSINATTPPVAGEPRDWVSPPVETRAPEAVVIAQARTAAASLPGALAEAAASVAVSPTEKFADELSEGDEIDVTVGKSTFYPVKHNGFDVGPIRVTVRLDRGESTGDAFRRARLVATQLYEAEFQIRLKEFSDMLGEGRQAVRSKFGEG